MLRKASSSDDTYSEGRDSTIESVRCTTTSYSKSDRADSDEWVESTLYPSF
jgi:hypothetical protein